MTRRGRRRGLGLFSLSFLDVMACGLGAVVLLFIIVDHGSANARPQSPQDALERALLARDIASSRQERDRVELAVERTRRREAELAGELARLSRQDASDEDYREEIAKLQSALSELRQRRDEREQAALRVAGAGRRQYLSGSSVTGQRIAILLDSSASMLAPTVIDALRWRNLPAERQRQAPKWRRAQEVARWVMANIPRAAEFHLSAFNAEATALTPGPGWHAASDRNALERTAGALDALAPSGGSSLENGLEAMRRLRPPPDAVYLITDGLPTMGKKPSGRKLVSGARRLKLFERAVARRPADAPVHTVLLKMEGDPMAAPSYWSLAIDSAGSFTSPTEDWP